MPLCKDKVRVRSKPLLRKDKVCVRSKPLFVTCAVLILLLRVVGLCMFIIWASDCFIREFQTTALCEGFSLFPVPKVFASIRLFLCALTSFLLILHIRCLNHFPGFRRILKHLVWKKYFWTLVVILFLVCGYDILIISQAQEKLKTLLYFFYIFEKSLGVALALCLNFLPSNASGLPQKKSGLKVWLYIVALIVYALEDYTMFILGSTIAVQNVLSVPHTANNEDSPDIAAVASLMLLIINNGLRYYLADFFSSKCFDLDVDILGGGTKSISESLAQPATVNQARENNEASSQMTTPLWTQGEISRTRRSS